MDTNFSEILDFVLLAEGGYVNDPDDPGGETKYGISKRAFPDEDIKNLTVERAKELYRQKYWDLIKGADLKSGVDAVVMDTAVNAGVSRSLQILRDSPDVTSFLFNRLEFYLTISRKNPKLQKYLWNWVSRTVKLYRLVKKLQERK